MKINCCKYKPTSTNERDGEWLADLGKGDGDSAVVDGEAEGHVAGEDEAHTVDAGADHPDHRLAALQRRRAPAVGEDRARGHQRALQRLLVQQPEVAPEPDDGHAAHAAAPTSCAFGRTLKACSTALGASSVAWEGSAAAAATNHEEGAEPILRRVRIEDPSPPQLPLG